MDIFYFLVTSMEQYVDKYGFHKNYFANNSGFLEGIIYSAAIGAVMALVLYFVLCNGKSVKPATRTNWGICLFIVAVVAFFAGDFLIIGSQGSGFYAFCDSFARNFMNDNIGNQQAITDCQVELNNIISNLNQGKDVALMFDVTNSLLGMLVFFGVSLGVKNLSKFGSQIPF